MDLITLISKFIEHSSWPISAIAIAIIFRKPISNLAKDIKKLKAGPIEFERFEELERKIEETSSKTDAIATKFTENDSASTQAPHGSKDSSCTQDASRSSLSEIEEKVLKAMATSRFAIRSLSGVSKEINDTKQNVEKTFNSLISKNLLTLVKNINGNNRWSLTQLGRDVAEELQ